MPDPLKFNWTLDEPVIPHSNTIIEYETWIPDVVLTAEEKADIAYYASLATDIATQCMTGQTADIKHGK